MTGKSVIGTNPLDAIIPPKAGKVAPRRKGQPVQRKPSPERERVTVQMLATTAERLKDCAYWERLTVVEIVEKGILAFVEKMESRRGEKYPTRTAPLKPGRPMKR